MSGLAGRGIGAGAGRGTRAGASSGWFSAKIMGQKMVAYLLKYKMVAVNEREISCLPNEKHIPRPTVATRGLR